ncbi:TetR/AcrR family transcriptional regulator [Evansella sp. AB-P1]|uniref:TetR/AcrR family transcriptional regulator n=1 Tax=Evansella sp. AB-P1 TaxID=3037653 RepID=UPI00241BFE50|nr:TetR/AcrR family transcriptional regulator [Evansella sp. AB-P1]MDG5789076.1 TetR/AcrR family transcriptional regulator [Evansella sp. AB-P1]
MTTKEKIIDAATEIFAEKGYKGMTMKEIANEVGIKPPSVYAFFKSKEDVFLHIYKDILSRHLDLAMNSANQFRDKPIKEQLEQILLQVINFQFKESLQMKVLIRLMLFPPEFMANSITADFFEVEKKEHEMLSSIFKQGMENGEIRSGDCNAIATAMLCMMDGLFWEMQRYDEATFHERFEVIWEQFWIGIKC